MSPSKRLSLFGGSRPWTSTDWTSQDDSVRGGTSVSYLIPSSTGATAVFTGNIDTTTLGGAGFASQRTTEDTTWDLSSYDGIEIVSRAGADGKTFTLVLKDSVPGVYNDQNTGLPREESTLSYEATFREGRVFLGWSAFKPFYRGREKEGVRGVDVRGIRRFSVMARSFFGGQSGPFRVTLVSVVAVKREPEGFYDEYDEVDDYESDGEEGRGEKGWGCAVL